MSLPNHVQVLRDNRAALLSCEAIGWLHMAGKAHVDFVRDASLECEEKKIAKSSWEELKWAVNLTCRFGTLPSIGTQSIVPGDFFEKHRERSDGLLGLIQGAHAMASGIEKNTPANYQKQPVAQTFLTTAFGHPVQNLLGPTPPPILAANAWSQTEQQLGALIDGLAARVKDPTNLAEWVNWRDKAIGPSGWLREAFTSTLAETRVPNNDITLWDQSYIAAALFKAAAAGALLTGSSFKWGNNLKQNTQWRVLTVGFGAEHYESRAVRIGDWTGTRQEIATFFNEICAFIEVDLALGACVYRDERVLAFTFPGQRLDDEGSVDDPTADVLRTCVEARIDELAHERMFETPPRVGVSKSTRSSVVMASELAAARRQLEVPVHRKWNVASDQSAGRHVCPVSFVRMGETRRGPAEQKQDVSKTCFGRRTGRRKRWEDSGGDTIWISEVADENDRVALLTFGLGLDGWLNGTHVDSLRAQSVVEWRTNNTSLAAIDANAPRDSLGTYVQGFVRCPKLNNGKLSDRVLKTLNEGFAHASSLETFFKKLVEDRVDEVSWALLDDPARAAWLTHQLFRKNASPGRVHRFWRTAQDFFRDALDEFRRYSSQENSSHRTSRVKLTISGDVKDLRVGDVYSGHLPFKPQDPFEILCRDTNFITVCNLARILESGETASRLGGITFEAKGDDGKRRPLTITKAEIAGAPLGSYAPLIVLEENPERFRVLVPLSKAETCVEYVVQKWEKEMARVWDRLPLRVGVVAFPRKTPFQAVIEATRSLEDDLALRDHQTWRVDEAKTLDGVTSINFVRDDGACQLIQVPTRLPDGMRNDVYYPNVAVEGTEREAHDFVVPSRDGSSSTYRWMAELKPRDGVVVSPSRYGCVFLDTTARRFESTKVHHLAHWHQQREIWRIVRVYAASDTSAHAVELALRDTRKQWTGPDGQLDEEAWLAFTRSLLVNEWGVQGKPLEFLLDAARTGVLEESLTWHMHVLKQNIGAKNER